jgi:hypothetical protein
MTEPLTAAALALAEALEAETKALAAGDYAAAIGLAPAKAQAIETFVAERGATPAITPSLLQRLREATQANRISLENALAVQGRIIGLLARAALPQAGAATGYSPRGGTASAAAAAARTASAVALSLKA